MQIHCTIIPIKTSILLSTAIALLFPLFLVAQKFDKNFHIYILLGQSNMAGRGKITPQYEKIQHERVFMLSKENKWEIAKHPLHFDKPKVAGVGPGLSFGIAMAEANKAVTIGLVPCSVGGTAISRWEPGAYDEATKTHPYDDALARIKEAMKYGPIKGILWHQGEADSKEKNASVYIDRLTALIQRLRKECGDPKLPIVVGQLAHYKSNYEYINNVLPELSSKVKNTILVSSEGLWHGGDGTHFDSPSATELGRRFANGMLQLQGYPSVQKEYIIGKNYTSPIDKNGWEVLFNGNNPNIRWRSIDGDSFPTESWTISDKLLKSIAKAKRKDIITREMFSNFELELEVKLTDSANSGIKYIVAPLKNEKGNTILNGPEYQLIDDCKHNWVTDNKNPTSSTGAAYLLYAPNPKDKNWKCQDWNRIKIIVKGQNIEHWLNGKKIVSYTRGSEDFRKKVAATKFREYENSPIQYGESEWGYILLQHHGDEASFRNIKIRRLK